MGSTLDRIKLFAEEWVSVVISLLRILLLAKKGTHVPELKNKNREIIIFGNGPSFKDLIDNHPDFWMEKERLMVNYSVCSDYFDIVKPEHYLIADPGFWLNKDKEERVFGNLRDKTTWPLNLYMPNVSFKSKNWQKMIENNKNIRVFVHNTVPVEGPSFFTRWAYSKGYGVPRPHNVLIPSLMISLRMNFKKIYLSGAEHSWIRDLGISDDNRVIMNFSHFYDHGKPDKKEMAQYAAVPLFQVLYHQYIIFKSYINIEEYAKQRQQKIINITPGSYIDAFDREKIEL